MTYQETLNTKEDEHIEFFELDFDPDEDNVDDKSIMSDKKYKTLKSKLNTILVILIDNARKSYVSGEEVEFSLKSHESRKRTLINTNVMILEECPTTHSSS